MYTPTSWVYTLYSLNREGEWRQSGLALYIETWDSSLAQVEKPPDSVHCSVFVCKYFNINDFRQRLPTYGIYDGS